MSTEVNNAFPERRLFPGELNLAATHGHSLAAAIAIYRTMRGGRVGQATALAPAVRAEGLLAPTVALPADPTPQAPAPAR